MPCSKPRSGREWLQCDELFDIARSTFFDALKSARRGDVVGELTQRFTAWLYFCRWRIEKTFDTFENDPEEDKAWATGNTAQLQQACFIAMAGNFLRYITQMLDIHHGLRDEKVVRKYQLQLDQRQANAAGKGRSLSPFMDAGRRMAKLSLQYIRCFRKHFFGKSPPETYLPDFGTALRAYL